MTNKAKIILPAIMAAGIGFQANAAEISTNTAQMQAMDKITGRVSVINVPVNSEVKFGSFSILVRDCKTRSPEETPENFAFVDVVDTNTNSDKVNIFKGWMLSSTPALNAIEHPVYDVWLLKCIDTDISQAKMMTAEELVARDNIPQQLVVKTTAPKIEDEAFSSNLSGEPIDLLPAAIRQAGEEQMAEEEVFPLQPMEQENLEPTTQSPAVAAENDEHAPQSLLNLGAKNASEDINAKVQIVEDTMTDGEPEIHSDARVLSLPEAEAQIENSGLPQIPASAIPGYEPQPQFSEEINIPDETEELPENVTFEEGNAPAQEISVEMPEPVVVQEIAAQPTPTEQPKNTEIKMPKPQISDDLLRELDEELGRAVTEN